MQTVTKLENNVKDSMCISNWTSCAKNNVYLWSHEHAGLLYEQIIFLGKNTI